MADIVIFNPNQYLKSVNTTEYTASSTLLINPDISAVSSVPIKYWKKGSGNTVVEMSQAEKDAVLTAELAARKSLADNFATQLPEVITALIKVINLRLSVGQKITKQEMIDAIKAEIV